MRSAAACYGTGAARCAEARSGRTPPPVFLPVHTISEPANGHDTKHMALSAGSGAEQVTGSKIEITLPDGTSVKVGHDVGLTMLRRVMTVLRR